MATPKKYEKIDFTPPEGVRKAAERGLAYRREHGRGGTPIGVARARDLANGKKLSPQTVKRMKAFFDRHAKNSKAEGFRPGEKGWPSNGKIADLLWGGPAGRTWAEKVVRQMEAADEKEGRSLRPFGSSQGIKPKVTVVFGPPASGKTTYVEDHKGDNDVVFDFNKVMSAITGGPMYSTNENLVSYCTDIRTLIIDKAIRSGKADHTWIIVTSPDDTLKERLKDVPVNYVEMTCSEEECLERIDAEGGRPGEHKDVVKKYYKESRSLAMQGVERRFVGSPEKKPAKGDLSIERRTDPQTGKQQVYLVGYAAKFHTDSLMMGDFIERISPEAFEIVERGKDLEGKPLETRGLYNHDPNHLIGRYPDTMKLTVDKVGLRYQILLPESRHDLAELVSRGDLRGSSFSFVVADDGERWSTEDGQSIRTVTKIKSLLDCGPVTYPAYADSTVAVAQRSYQQYKLRCKSPSKSVTRRIESLERFIAERRDCGTGKGGFQKGNTCGGGGSSSKPAAKQKPLDANDPKAVKEFLAQLAKETGKSVPRKKKKPTPQQQAAKSKATQEKSQQYHDDIQPLKDTLRDHGISWPAYATKANDYVRKTDGLNRKDFHREAAAAADEGPDSLKKFLNENGLGEFSSRIGRKRGGSRSLVSSRDCGTGKGGFQKGNTCGGGSGGGSSSKPAKKKSGPYMELRPGTQDVKKGSKKTKSAQQFIDKAREGQTTVAGKSGGKGDDGGGVQTWSKGDSYPWVSSQHGTDEGYVQAKHPDGSTSSKHYFKKGGAAKARKSLAEELQKKKKKRSFREPASLRATRVAREIINEFRDCGTGAGGFKKGNTCGGESKSPAKKKSSTKSGKKKKKSRDPLIAAAAGATEGAIIGAAVGGTPASAAIGAATQVAFGEAFRRIGKSIASRVRKVVSSLGMSQKSMSEGAAEALGTQKKPKAFVGDKNSVMFESKDDVLVVSKGDVFGDGSSGSTVMGVPSRKENYTPEKIDRMTSGAKKMGADQIALHATSSAAQKALQDAGFTRVEGSKVRKSSKGKLFKKILKTLDQVATGGLVTDAVKTTKDLAYGEVDLRPKRRMPKPGNI